MIITQPDIRAADFCSRRARKWFAQHGLSWNDFLEHGIDAEILLATGDAQAVKVVEAARGRQE